jgi:hypothetical protein
LLPKTRYGSYERKQDKTKECSPPSALRPISSATISCTVRAKTVKRQQRLIPPFQAKEWVKGRDAFPRHPRVSAHNRQRIVFIPSGEMPQTRMDERRRPFEDRWRHSGSIYATKMFAALKMALTRLFCSSVSIQ